MRRFIMRGIGMEFLHVFIHSKKLKKKSKQDEETFSKILKNALYIKLNCQSYLFGIVIFLLCEAFHAK